MKFSVDDDSMCGHCTSPYLLIEADENTPYDTDLESEPMHDHSCPSLRPDFTDLWTSHDSAMCNVENSFEGKRELLAEAKGAFERIDAEEEWADEDWVDA
ncbi:hypothetical protein [Rhodococcus opacus]